MTSPIPIIKIKRNVDTKPLAQTQPAEQPDICTEPIALTSTSIVTPLGLPEKSSLEELTSVDKLLIIKQLQVRSMLFLRGPKNKFCVSTPDHNLIFTIEEQNSGRDVYRWLAGYLCYGHRPLKLSVLNNEGTEVMTINRPYACTSRVLPCQLQSLEIFSPPGNLLGSVQQQWTAVKPFYLVLNEAAEPVFHISGPYVTVSFFQDVLFEIERIDGEHVGTIFKLWEGLGHALFYSAVEDRFGVAFDNNLNVQEKALLMAVSILLDYMYYDS